MNTSFYQYTQKKRASIIFRVQEISESVINLLILIFVIFFFFIVDVGAGYLTINKTDLNGPVAHPRT